MGRAGTARVGTGGSPNGCLPDVQRTGADILTFSQSKSGLDFLSLARGLKKCFIMRKYV